MVIDSIKTITVDVSDYGRYNSNVTAMQADNTSRYVHVIVLNDDHRVDVTSLYPVLRGTKPDGTTIFNSCTIDNNEIVVELTPQILAVPGLVKCDIALYQYLPEQGSSNNNGVISAFPFNIIVVPASFDPTSVVSSDEFEVLQEAMAAIASIAELPAYEQSVANIENQIGNHTVETDVPANAVFTDTTYEAATSSTDGLMTSEMVGKLEGIQSNAEVNQDAYSNIQIGLNVLPAHQHMDTVEFAGNNISITSETGILNRNKVIFGIDSTNVTNALGYTPAQLDGNGKIPAEELPGGIGTTVTQSSIDGNIVVDGVEMQVYRYNNDTNLLNYIADQIDLAVVAAINDSY